MNQENKDYFILEKTPDNFTVYFNKKYYGYFTSRQGAEEYLKILIEGSDDESNYIRPM